MRSPLGKNPRVAMSTLTLHPAALLLNKYP